MPFKNPEDKREWNRLENRRRVLTGYYRDWKRDNEVGGKRVYNKRRYTGYCEVCGRIFADNKKGQFAYHHWDDERPDYGLYLCCTCHAMAEGIEKNLDQVYLMLKALVDSDLKIILEERDG